MCSGMGGQQPYMTQASPGPQALRPLQVPMGRNFQPQAFRSGGNDFRMPVLQAPGGNMQDFSKLFQMPVQGGQDIFREPMQAPPVGGNDVYNEKIYTPVPPPIIPGQPPVQPPGQPPVQPPVQPPAPPVPPVQPPISGPRPLSRGPSQQVAAPSGPFAGTDLAAYATPQGDGFTGTRDGQNFFRGQLWAPEGLAQGGGVGPVQSNAFASYLRNALPRLNAGLTPGSAEYLSNQGLLAQLGGPYTGGQRFGG